MNPLEALQVIKNVLDAATKSGVFTNMEASFTAANAFNVISKFLDDNKKQDNG